MKASMLWGGFDFLEVIDMGAFHLIFHGILPLVIIPLVGYLSKSLFQ
jgi:hypothetical protein